MFNILLPVSQHASMYCNTAIVSQSGLQKSSGEASTLVKSRWIMVVLGYPDDLIQVAPSIDILQRVIKVCGVYASERIASW